jgi:hypothetical protein
MRGPRDIHCSYIAFFGDEMYSTVSHVRAIFTTIKWNPFKIHIVIIQIDIIKEQK